MHVSLLLEMAADGFGDRQAVGGRSDGLTYAQLLDRARRTAAVLHASQCANVGLIDTNSAAVPVLLFGASIAGAAFVPMNYRLADDKLRAVASQISPAHVVVGEHAASRLDGLDGVFTFLRSELEQRLDTVAPMGDGAADADGVAVLLFTSGTSGEPKAAVLRHRHLTSYVISSVEFAGAHADEATLVSVPPYHIAGVSAILSSVYAGRRIVYLAQFDPAEWVRVAREEAITHAMVVPTMLGRILDELDRSGRSLPMLRHVSYGGGRMPLPVVERALRMLPHADLVNAYGLTETSSTVAVLGPDDHRDALASDDPLVRRRLTSVGRPLPSVEVEIRDANGDAVEANVHGEVYVRGDQVAGEYLGQSLVGADGWFATRDAGVVDDDGFLYLDGRTDDVIVRGGENMSPGEIEDVLVAHPAVSEACVVGLPDTEWGETVAAAVVLRDDATITDGELQEWVAARLRSSRTPTVVQVRDDLPYTDTGKLLRRVVRTELSERTSVP